MSELKSYLYQKIDSYRSAYIFFLIMSIASFVLTIETPEEPAMGITFGFFFGLFLAFFCFVNSCKRKLASL